MKNFLDRGSDYKSTGNSCKFYVSVDHELQDLDKSLEDINYEKSQPKLLDGEIIITEGTRVLFFPYGAERTRGLLGNLYVTNFRFLFEAYEEDDSEVESLHQKNHLLGKYGACLTNIESLHQLSGEKKRRLIQDSQLTDKIKTLQIVCKNMKVFTFNFDQSPITQGKNIAKTLFHHAFPGRHQLLFAYDHRCPKQNVLGASPFYLGYEQEPKFVFMFGNAKVKPGKQPEGVALFSERSEWENELTRTCSMSASSWRISAQNQGFQMSTTLPKWLIVPHSVLDYDFITASQSFRCNRPPIWTWSSPNGAALVRMADLLPTITDRTQENRMLENIRKCHPDLKVPSIKYLDKELPSVSELYQSYIKLKELCMPDNHRQFKTQDSHLFSALENTKWLQYVSSCLKVVVDAAQEIQKGTTVVLQESDGRDMSAVVSSLVQLVLDSHTRSILGFQSLVQKEWVALGHPFCKRLGHIRTNHSEQSPVFLFFLDCVWQLQNQFPSNFEFTETYLTTLWDSVHVSLFDTFLFDCEKDRLDAFTSTTDRLEPRSVWEWNYQFSQRDTELFINPLYEFSQLCLVDEKSRNPVLMPEPGLPVMELWTQCYFRWVPLLSIKCGGRPQIDIAHRQLIRRIRSLLNDVLSAKKGPSVNNNKCVVPNNNNASNTQNFCRLNESDEENFGEKDVQTLFKNKDLIDNFFPFVVGANTLNTSVLANSSDIAEFDTLSVSNIAQ